jgi:hypothetical protein
LAPFTRLFAVVPGVTPKYPPLIVEPLTVSFRKPNSLSSPYSNLKTR